MLRYWAVFALALFATALRAEGNPPTTSSSSQIFFTSYVNYAIKGGNDRRMAYLYIDGGSSTEFYDGWAGQIKDRRHEFPYDEKVDRFFVKGSPVLHGPAADSAATAQYLQLRNGLIAEHRRGFYEQLRLLLEQDHEGVTPRRILPRWRSSVADSVTAIKFEGPTNGLLYQVYQGADGVTRSFEARNMNTGMQPLQIFWESSPVILGMIGTMTADAIDAINTASRMAKSSGYKSNSPTKIADDGTEP